MLVDDVLPAVDLALDVCDQGLTVTVRWMDHAILSLRRANKLAPPPRLIASNTQGSANTWFLAFGQETPHTALQDSVTLRGMAEDGRVVEFSRPILPNAKVWDLCFMASPGAAGVMVTPTLSAAEPIEDKAMPSEIWAVKIEIRRSGRPPMRRTLKVLSPLLLGTVRKMGVSEPLCI